MCIRICIRCFVKDQRILAEFALLFLITAFTLELIYVANLPWNKQEFTGTYIAAAVLGIIALVFMGIKFMVHEAINLWPNNKITLIKVNSFVAFISIACSLASIICCAVSENFQDSGTERIAWSVPGLLLSMLLYYMTIRKLDIKEKRKIQMAELRARNELNQMHVSAYTNSAIEIQPKTVVVVQ